MATTSGGAYRRPSPVTRFPKTTGAGSAAGDPPRAGGLARPAASTASLEAGEVASGEREDVPAEAGHLISQDYRHRVASKGDPPRADGLARPAASTASLEAGEVASGEREDV
ncbi:hypothetical protein ACLHZ0_19920, partial [Aeromonas salmonicida]|uniref:hypothetical protein n=1 Tax=Aeromonas salmonicida TaxID=645 RepID=UPI003D07E326